MGVSFKIARMGTRYRSRLAQIQDEDDDNESVDSQPSVNQGNFSGIGDKISDLSNVLAKTELHSASDDIEASFSLNLFPEGFSIGKVSESFSNAPEQLYPYNRASEMLFSAIEYGWLPGDTFDDLPFKYVNGSVLCTIQDYRNCLSHKGGICSIEKSPTVNRVILRMSMENVVKDILSISDDSWTYKDILEVESCILKALQPNLCLSPQPLLGKHCREPLAKKVNLDISWSWKKRDQHNAPATNQVFSNSCHVNVTPGQNSNFLGGFVHQDREVVCAKENIPTPILNQEPNTLQEMKSHSYPLTSLPNCHLGETRDLSTLAESTTSNVSVSKRSSIKRTSDQTKLTSSNLNVKVRCQKQAIQGPPLKKPKKEPVDYSYQQFPRKSIETSAPTQLWWQSTVLHQQIEAEKALPERFQDKGCSSQLIKNGLPSNREGILYSQVGSVNSKVKLEPQEIFFPNLEFENMKDNYFGKDRRVNSSDGVHFQEQQSLQLVKTNNAIVNTLQMPFMQPIEKSLRKGHVTSRRKVPEKHQLIYDGSTPASSRNMDSFQIEASTPSKRKATPLKGFSINLVDSRANINHANMATANSLSEGIQFLPQTSEIKGDAILERLLKIKEVTQRCKLTKKRKMDQDPVRRQIFHATTMVAFYLSNFDNSRNSEATTMDKVSLSQLSMDKSAVLITRTLMFVRTHSLVYQGNEIDVNGRKFQVRLVLTQKFNNGTVEANVLYGCEDETGSTVLSPLPTFPSAHSADLFASQFSLLMAREGYSLASDRVEPMYPDTEGSSSSQQCSTINQSAGAFRLSSSTSTPGLLPCMLSPMTGNTSALNSSQLLSKQILSGAQLLPAENVVSSPQFTSSCSPKLEPGIAAQFSSLTLEMQEIMNRRSELQLQLKQRHRHQELLMQRRAMLGAPTATTGLSGSPRLGGRNGIQGFRNFSIGSSGNVTGPMASKPNILGGHTPLSGNIGQKNNLSSNTFGLNDSNQLLASSSGYLAAVSYMLGPADGQWRGLEDGVPIQRNDLLVPINNPKVPGVPLIQRNDLLVPINSPKVPEIPCTLGSQHQVQMQMYQPEVQRPQPCMLQQQDIRLLIDNLQSVNFATQQVGSSPTHLSPQQFAQQPQINLHYKNPGSVLEEMNTRNTMGSQGRVERGWKMHGAANGSKKI